MSKELKTYIDQALSKGAQKAEIRKTLSDSGWSGKVIDKLLAQYVGIDAHGLPIPAPIMQSHHIARDLFVYLLSLITLSTSAFGVGQLLFELINYYLPDTVNNYEYYASSCVSWAIAELIVAFPIFTWVSVWIARDITQSPQKRESLIRKLMVYFILIISAVVCLGDLISVLYQFLQGDMTLRFFAKAMVVLGISLTIFVYYLYEVRRDDALVKEISQ